MNDYSITVKGWICHRCHLFVTEGQYHQCPIVLPWEVWGQPDNDTVRLTTNSDRELLLDIQLRLMQIEEALKKLEA